MPYKFKCIHCNHEIFTKLLTIGGKLSCEKCDKDVIVPEDAWDIEKDPFRPITPPASQEPKSKNDKNLKDYPSLKFLSGVANFIAWFGVITSIIGGFIYIVRVAGNSPEITIIALVTLTLGTFILFVFWRAISEIIILFVDMAQDTRKIRLNQTNKK